MYPLREDDYQSDLQQAVSDIKRRILLILLHCTDEAERPILGPVRPGPEGEEFLRNAITTFRLSCRPSANTGRRSAGSMQPTKTTLCTQCEHY